METVRMLVNRYPLTIFVLLAYTLSWWVIPFANGGILPHGPFLAALIVLALTIGRVGVGNLFRKMTSWSGPWYWLLIGPGLVVTYLLVALILNLLMGATISNTAHLDSFLPTLAILMLMGGVWEEPGWTGYALPLLQRRYADRRYTALTASLHLGAIRAVWHLPLMLSGAIPWYDVIFFTIAFQFLITWLYNRTGGSVLIPMLFHLASNVIGGGLLIPLFSGVDHTQFYVLFIVTAWALALFLCWRSSWKMGFQSEEN